MSQNERALFDLSPWRPVVEAGGAGAFLERSPNDILVSGDFDTEVPLMIGLNDKEGSVVYGEALVWLRKVAPRAKPRAALTLTRVLPQPRWATTT